MTVEPCKLLKGLAPQVGLEPTTLRLTAGCSTIELLRNRANTFKFPYGIGECQPFEGGSRAAK